MDRQEAVHCKRSWTIPNFVEEGIDVLREVEAPVASGGQDQRLPGRMQLLRKQCHHLLPPLRQVGRLPPVSSVPADVIVATW
jgi:hypothetical protein